MSEIIFEVREDEIDGGYNAAALDHGIHTQGDTLEELRAMVKEAVDCYWYIYLERLYLKARAKGLQIPQPGAKPEWR